MIDLVNFHIPRRIISCNEKGKVTRILSPLSTTIAHYHIEGFHPRTVFSETLCYECGVPLKNCPCKDPVNTA